MKFCSECEESGITTPAEYRQEWTWIWRSGAEVIIEVLTCEEHLFGEEDRDLLAQGYTLKIEKIEK